MAHAHPQGSPGAQPFYESNVEQHHPYRAGRGAGGIEFADPAQYGAAHAAAAAAAGGHLDGTAAGASGMPAEAMQTPFTLYIMNPREEDGQLNADGIAVYIYTSAPEWFRQWITVEDLRDPQKLRARPKQVCYTPQLYDLYQKKFFLAGTATLNAMLVLAHRAGVYLDMRPTNFILWEGAMVPREFMSTQDAAGTGAQGQRLQRAPSAAAAAGGRERHVADARAASFGRHPAAPAGAHRGANASSPGMGSGMGLSHARASSHRNANDGPRPRHGIDGPGAAGPEHAAVGQGSEEKQDDLGDASVRDAALFSAEIRSCFDPEGEAINSEMRLAPVDGFSVIVDAAHDPDRDPSSGRERGSGDGSLRHVSESDLVTSDADAEQIKQAREKQSAAIALILQQRRTESGGKAIEPTDSRTAYARQSQTASEAVIKARDSQLERARGAVQRTSHEAWVKAHTQNVDDIRGQMMISSEDATALMHQRQQVMGAAAHHGDMRVAGAGMGGNGAATPPTTAAAAAPAAAAGMPGPGAGAGGGARYSHAGMGAGMGPGGAQY